MNKISWKRYAAGVVVGVITVSLVLIGIFCSSILDSVIGVSVLAVVAVMGAWGASKDYYDR